MGRLSQALILTASLTTAGCTPARPQAGPPARPARACELSCEPRQGCAELADDLLGARKLMIQCVGQEADRGHLADAHRCFRAARLLESARWWLRTLMVSDEVTRVYQPSPQRHRRFLCSIQRLARCQTSAQVEAAYLDMIQHYP